MAMDISARTLKDSVRRGLARVIRPAARAYVQGAPWSAGKVGVYGLWDRHVAWIPYETTVRTKLGDRMQISLPDLISRTLYMTGLWEPVITEYIRTSLKPGDTFVDVGANIGYYSLLASRIVGPRGRVIAIEASPANYERLLKNLAFNGAQNVRTVNAAAASGPGELPLYMGPADNRGHATTVTSLAEKEDLRLETVVSADTLEQLVGSDDLKRARLIKIDVEGAERTVLTPLFSSLAEFSTETEWLLELSPRYCEHGQQDVDEIFDAFVANGYSAYTIPNKYDHEFVLLNNIKQIGLAPLTAAPRAGVQDVLMSRTAKN